MAKGLDAVARLDWLAAIAADPSAPGSALRVAVALAKRQNTQTGRLNPSRATICRDSALSDRAVGRGLTCLESAGFLVIHRSSGGGRSNSNQYDLLTPCASAPQTRNLTRKVTRKEKTQVDSAESTSGRDDEKVKTKDLHGRIIATYHKLLPELRVVVTARWPGSAREKALDARLKEHGQHTTPDFWKWFFCAVRTNPHWMGSNGREWKADLGWVLKRENFDKVVEWAESNGDAVDRELARWYPGGEEAPIPAGSVPRGTTRRRKSLMEAFHAE